jgi:hypothetical protein
MLCQKDRWNETVMVPKTNIILIDSVKYFGCPLFVQNGSRRVGEKKIVMNVHDVKNGIIHVKLESWHGTKEMWKTEGWNSINNERHLLGELEQEQEQEDEGIFTFDYDDAAALAGDNSTFARSSLEQRKLKKE